MPLQLLRKVARPEFSVKIHIVQAGTSAVSFDILATVFWAAEAARRKVNYFLGGFNFNVLLGQRKKWRERILSAVHCNFRRSLARLLCSVHVVWVCNVYFARVGFSSLRSSIVDMSMCSRTVQSVFSSSFESLLAL